MADEKAALLHGPVAIVETGGIVCDWIKSSFCVYQVAGLWKGLDIVPK